MTKEEIIERVKPWALVLKDMCEEVERGCTLQLGDLLTNCCIRRGVAYPPADVEQALLSHVFRRIAAGAPAPKGFA